MDYLLDTSALLAHYRKEAGWENVQTIFDDANAVVLIASVSLAELARRLKDLGAPEKEAAQAALDYGALSSNIVAIDSHVAMSAFYLGGRASKRVPLVDALIAAAAHVREACLVHRDDHFDAMPEDAVRSLHLGRQ